MPLARVMVLLTLVAAMGATGYRHSRSHGLNHREGPASLLEELPEDTLNLLQTRPAGALQPHNQPSAAEATTTPAPPTRKSKSLSPLDIRPDAGGEAVPVKFGMLCKEFYGLDFKQNTVTGDIILTLQWVDNRTTDLLPKGRSEVTISQKSADANMWMPDIAITNQEIDGTQVISTSVTVNQNGEVRKVQRILAIVKNIFDISAFPFDIQSLRFRIASTTFLSEDLHLLVLGDEGTNGVKDDIFVDTEFDFVNSSTHVFEEQDGSLKKSRGEFVMEVKRNSAACFRTFILPQLLLLAIAYTVFLFPLAPGFIMPRVATSMTGFMSLMVLSIRTSSLLPVRGRSSWIDVFEESCETIMFTFCCLNLFLEAISHELVLPAVASKMQFELRCFLPIVIALVITVCFSRTDGTGLSLLSLHTKFVFYGPLIPYLGWCAYRVMDARAKKKEAASAGC